MTKKIVKHFDGENRRIHLSKGVSKFCPRKMYLEYREALNKDESLSKFSPLLRFHDGAISIGGTKIIDKYLVLINGAKIVPFEKATKG